VPERRHPTTLPRLDVNAIPHIQYFHRGRDISSLRGIRTPAAPQENIHEYTGKDTGIFVAFGHDLSRAVTSWDKLPAPLKAAILAIVSSAASQEGK
jgi:hypothetical protein